MHRRDTRSPTSGDGRRAGLVPGTHPAKRGSIHAGRREDSHQSRNPRGDRGKFPVLLLTQTIRGKGLPAQAELVQGEMTSRCLAAASRAWPPAQAATRRAACTGPPQPRRAAVGGPAHAGPPAPAPARPCALRPAPCGKPATAKRAAGAQHPARGDPFPRQQPMTDRPRAWTRSSARPYASPQNAEPFSSRGPAQERRRCHSAATPPTPDAPRPRFPSPPARASCGLRRASRPTAPWTPVRCRTPRGCVRARTGNSGVEPFRELPAHPTRSKGPRP